ncbi:outer membrane protein [Salinibacter altiplanensis]|uniref:outer membrane protein n=1 Tax=Salinibacter altiplanensis TaxID=1803181 RepID=UPI000C9FEE57|nr:outer membrane beta-barrel protein [Salinibacter altiplanensis]
MKRFASLAAVAFALTIAFPYTAQAQTESNSGFEIGPRVTIDVGDIEEFALGGNVRYDLSQDVEEPVQLAGAFDYYFADDQGGADVTIYTIDLNAHYIFPTEETFSPYAGGGLGITSSEVGGISDTDTGLNLVGGVEFDTGSFQPFVQGQVTIGNPDRIGITGGLLFAL